MSEFAVYRTLGNGRCLVLDDTRIAGGKPDYRGNNYITSWVTNETYGPVDELKSENGKLRELVRDFDKCLTEAVRLAYIQGHMTIYDGTLLDSLHPRMRELGIEVKA